MNPCPKPVKRPPKTRAPMPRSRMKRSARGTAHSRRKRETGFMAYTRRWPCDVLGAFLEEFGSLPPAFPRCRYHVQFMHLPHRAAMGARGPDSMGAAGCVGHHQDIDGQVGGKGPWYVALGWEGQQRLRERLRMRSRQRWEAIGQEERERWDALSGPPTA